jgi:hypothetical protein
MGRVRLNEPAVIVQDRVDGLGLIRRRRREQLPEASRLDGRQDGPRFDRFEVVGHDVDNLVCCSSKLVRRHVPEQ